MPQSGEVIQVLLVPILKNGETPGDVYGATVDQATGTFVASGKDLKGLPPGKYRVVVQLQKNKQDLLDGKFEWVTRPSYSMLTRTPRRS